MKKTILFCLLLMSIGITAQNPQEKKKVEIDPEEVTQQYTDMLEEELKLNEKQKEQVYKIYLQQARKKKSAIESLSQGEQPSGPPPNENGGRMDPGMGGNGQRPPMREHNTGNEGEMPPPQPQAYSESEKDIKKREKKMEKILDKSQYQRWLEIEEDKALKEEQQQRKEELERLYPQLQKEKINEDSQAQ